MTAWLRTLTLSAALLAVSAAPAAAQAVDLDSATIADLNAAFDRGTLTAEQLVRLCLARIGAYDRRGPELHAVITLNPKAIETARALDAERKAKGRRSPLHGIPVVLKDNYDTADLPTTGASVLLEAREAWYRAVRWREFPVQVAAYLATLGPAYPKTLDELIERARRVNAPRPDGAGPNPSRWSLFAREAKSGALEDAEYTAVRDHALAAMRVIVEGILAAGTLDAIVYPTSPTRPSLIAGPSGGGGRDVPSPVTIANMTGFPDLIVPAGFTSDRLPVGISFFGPAFSEPRLLALGYAFEQATKARRRPAHTPALPGETIRIR